MLYSQLENQQVAPPTQSFVTRPLCLIESYTLDALRVSHCYMGIFEMAAMPFPCNGPLLCCVNIPYKLFKTAISCNVIIACFPLHRVPQKKKGSKTLVIKQMTVDKECFFSE